MIESVTLSEECHVVVVGQKQACVSYLSWFDEKHVFAVFHSKSHKNENSIKSKREPVILLNSQPVEPAGQPLYTCGTHIRLKKNACLLDLRPAAQSYSLLKNACLLASRHRVMSYSKCLLNSCWGPEAVIFG